MRLTIASPSKAFVSATDHELSLLTKSLAYINTANQHELRRHANNHWMKTKNPEAWKATYEEIKATIHKTVLFQEDDGRYFIRPASIPYIGESVVVEPPTSTVKYPTAKAVPWEKPLPFMLYPYQQHSVDKLLAVKHGNVQLCTGSGKSAIILKICRETGFKTAIVAPSKVIFDELLEKFEFHLGRNNVGTFGDGKKKLGKRFTICIGDSLANVERGTPEWEFFSGLDMLCIDESHTWGANSLETVCHGVLSEIPYRFFFSGTQTRGDGAEKLLQSIIGETVYTLNTADAVKGGYISDHSFLIVGLSSSNPNYQSPDGMNMKRAHFLRNNNIAHFVAKLANADATLNKRQTLVLVEELSQISALAKLLTVPFVYAHSETKPARLAELGLQKVKSKESVEAFNKAEAMVLIGTSCIATGTNIFPTHNCVNWVGGSSEIKTKQGAVGRAVRKGEANPWAKNCTPKANVKIFDFDIKDQYLMNKQCEDRIEYYKESGTDIKSIWLK